MAVIIGMDAVSCHGGRISCPQRPPILLHGFAQIHHQLGLPRHSRQNPLAIGCQHLVIAFIGPVIAIICLAQRIKRAAIAGPVKGDGRGHGRLASSPVHPAYRLLHPAAKGGKAPLLQRIINSVVHAIKEQHPVGLRHRYSPIQAVQPAGPGEGVSRLAQAR